MSSATFAAARPGTTRPTGLLACILTLVVAACDGGDPTPTATVTAEPRPGPGDTTPGTAVTPPPGSTPATVASPQADFYVVPDPLPPSAPGEVVWAERVEAPEGVIAWRVLYHSRTIAGQPIAVSGLIAAPDADPPPGGYPVLAYAHGTTGLADECAPSRAARPLRGDGNGRLLPLPPLWEHGFIVTATDYEGLGTPGRHPYIVGGSEARGVLDSVRAARRLPGIAASETTIALGASQGGHAALFAGELAPAYAPDVPLTGVVALAPGAELAQAALLLGGDPTAVGYAVAIAAGFEAAYPEARLDTILTPGAIEGLRVVDEACMGDVLAAFAGPVDEVLRIERLVEDPWPRILEENSPGRFPNSAPVFVGQGTADPLVIPELTDALVARMCLNGDSVSYRRYLGASHDGVVDAAFDDVVAWIDDRLAGHEPPADC